MRIPRRLIWLTLLPGLALSSEIHRCTGDAGEPLFSQHPCDTGSTVLVVQPAPDTHPHAGLRPSEIAWLAARQTDARAGRGGRESLPRGSDQAAARQAYRCARRRHALDAVNAALRHGYRPAQGERLRRRRQAHQDYLSAFCP